MSTNFYFKSLKLTNFRSFEYLNVEKLKRINIIGGFNGVGKTAFLESVFYILDRNNPIGLITPLNWRRFQSQSGIDPKQLLNNPDIFDACLESVHRDGRNRIKFKIQETPENSTFSISANGLPISMESSFANQKGIYITGENEEDETVSEQFIMQTVDGVVGNSIKVDSRLVPKAQMVSISVRAGVQQLATYLSQIIMTGRKEKLLSYLQNLVPELSDLQTLQDGAIPQIYGTIGNKLLPIQYLGDGFQNLLQTLTAIMNATNGVVLLDEIDAAIHYSKISTIWSIIAKIANEENCQIFASTHSRECINRAAHGIGHAGRQADFQYIRLEKRSGKHHVVSYSFSEIEEAEIENIEIR